MPSRFAVAALALMAGASAWADAPIQLRMMAGGFGLPPKEATDPRSVARRAVFEEFQRLNPDVQVVNAGGLSISGGRGEAMFLMAMAGDLAPDVFYVNFRQYHNYIGQGFCRPLDDLVAKDPDVLARVNPVVRRVLTSYDGKVYAIPFWQVAQGLYYRKDHFAQAGLDPNRPPRTWEELYRFGQKLVEANPNRAAFAFSNPPGYHWSNFVYQAGGEVVAPGEGNQWRATIDTSAGVQALEFFRRLTVEKWQGADGRTYGPVAQISPNFSLDVGQGKMSMWFQYIDDQLVNTSDLNPSVLGIAAMPAGPGGSANEVNAGMWAINANIKDPKRLDAAWRFIQYFAGDEANRVRTTRLVELGLGNMVQPALLKRFGFDDIAATVDPAFLQANEDLFRNGDPEPYGANVQQVYTVLDNALDRARLEPNRPAMEILEETAEEMNQKLLGYTPPEILRVQRAWAAGIGIVVLVVSAVLLALGWRKLRKADQEFVEHIPAGLSRPRVLRFMSVCLFPAAASILVWAYYPLFKGLVIAFQDYRIMRGATWVGFDNFIAVFTQPIFYKSLVNSFIYVGLTIAIGFFLPIFLALALNEIPKAKMFFRTVFYLPAMTSPIVVALLWRQFYDKSETGILNTVLEPVINGLNAVIGVVGMSPLPTANDWLGNPNLAMFAVVLPGIWAGAGPGSILYLAALKNISEDRYEAADLDGASWWTKIVQITLPALKPLILINLLGVFIAGFKAMENVFVLTAGGPLYATHTVGLEVWSNAFLFLKFGYATAAAWVMGAILIGFTLIQVRSLLRMRFSTAKA